MLLEKTGWDNESTLFCSLSTWQNFDSYKSMSVTGAFIWYCPVTTTRTADASIPMSRVLPHNHQSTSATQHIVDSVLIMISNVCFIKINDFSMISIVAILFLSRGMPARRTIYYLYLMIYHQQSFIINNIIICHCL